MKTLIVRVFPVLFVAVALMAMVTMIWSRSSSAANIAQPVVVQSPTYAISYEQAGGIAKDTEPYAAIIEAPVLSLIHI